MCSSQYIRPGKGQGKLLLVFDRKVDSLLGGRKLEVVDAAFDGGGRRQDGTSKGVFCKVVFVVKECSSEINGGTRF